MSVGQENLPYAAQFVNQWSRTSGRRVGRLGACAEVSCMFLCTADGRRRLARSSDVLQKNGAPENEERHLPDRARFAVSESSERMVPMLEDQRDTATCIA